MVTGGVIGNGKVRDILLKNKGKTIQKNKIQRAEEKITETLHQNFKIFNNKMSTDTILTIMHEDLYGFDKYLTKEILKHMATLKNSIWELKDEYKNI